MSVSMLKGDMTLWLPNMRRSSCISVEWLEKVHSSGNGAS